MAPVVLTVNVGSSSLKVYLISPDRDLLLKGIVEKIGSERAEWRLDLANGQEMKSEGRIERAEGAVDLLKEWLEAEGETPAAIAHRIVHGGPDLTQHVIVTDDVVEQLRRVENLAPEHIPAELGLLDTLRRSFPEALHIACFDTAFHATLPEVARTLPLPRRIRERGVRRYGFHGLSYEYLVAWLDERGLREGRTVLAHLGNGASMAAVRDGVGIDTTMGLTPAGGLVMGTRCGDIDPGTFRFLARECELRPEEIDRLVNHESGLAGLSDGKSDVRELLAARDQDASAALALDVFGLSARKHLCAMAASLGGLDRIVFTGGIGEHAPAIREMILSDLEFLGLRLDAEANKESRTVISAADSSINILVVPANEEAAMARIATHLLNTEKPTP